VDELNPYAPPRAEVTLEPTGTGVWRDGTLLLMTRTAQLPARCLKCNAPADGGTLRRKLSWHHPLIYALIVISPIIYIIVALIVRQTATVALPICAQHRHKRNRAIAVAWLICLGGLVLFFLGLADRDYAGQFALAALVLLVTGLIYGLVASQVAVPSKIDASSVWLKKVSPDYLAELPEWARAD
jgi:hypothetical protein